jgi:hypothetical protein
MQLPLKANVFHPYRCQFLSGCIRIEFIRMEHFLEQMEHLGVQMEHFLGC